MLSIIKDKVMTTVANKIMKKLIWESTGIDMDFDVHQVSIIHENGKVKGHLDFDFEMDDKEIERIMKNIGL